MQYTAYYIAYAIYSGLSSTGLTIIDSTCHASSGLDMTRFLLPCAAFAQAGTIAYPLSYGWSSQLALLLPYRGTRSRHCQAVQAAVAGDSGDPWQQAVAVA